MSINDFLHNHPEFSELIRIVSDANDIDPALVEKDYWIMHCLFGLQQLGFSFQLKGGTSLSKGFQIIQRFSEDLDIRIEPPSDMDIKIGRNQDKPAHLESRKKFYDWLAQTIKIDGIHEVQRDLAFDDEKYRNGGIRLHYKALGGSFEGLKDGILLEVGFDDVTPNFPTTISSWAYDYAVGKVSVKDNRALNVKCYHPGYTLVEKLQAISTKYHRQQDSGTFPINFMRHYYDVHCLLHNEVVQKFLGTAEYNAHKTKRFRSTDPDVAKNEAFFLKDPKTRTKYKAAYQASASIYYQGQPDFDEILATLSRYAEKL